MKFQDYVVLWFDVDNEWVATACHPYDVERGYVQLKLLDKERNRWYNAGLRSFKECVGVTRYAFSSDDCNILKWEERNKLFEKYPQLKKLVA